MTALPPPELPFDAEVLSAYLDGELSPDERAQVERLLEGDEAARTELAAIAEARTWVRDLPEVDPPDGFLERAITATAAAPASDGAPKKHKWGMLNLVATAAVWVVVLGFVSVNRSNDVAPDASTFAQTHTEASAGISGLIGSLGSGRPEQQQAPQVELGEPYWAPVSLPGDLRLRQVQINDDLVGLMYCNDSGADLVMLYEEPGQLDPSAIEGARKATIAGQDAWVVETGAALVAIVPRADLVYAVVGPRDGALVEAVAAELPDPPAPSLTDRLGAAGRGLLDSFGLG